MAKKCVKGIEEKIRFRTLYKYECMRRHCDYQKDFDRYTTLEEKYNDLGDALNRQEGELGAEQEKEWAEIEREMKEIRKKYNTTRMCSATKSTDWASVGERVYAALPVWHWDSTGKVLSSGEVIEFHVDIDRDKEEILHDIDVWIGVIKRRNDGRKNNRHIKKMKRYLAVFDLRNQRPQVSYELIVSQLKEFYSKEKEAIDVAKHDFQKVFYDIYGVPYKEYDKKEFLKSNISKRCDSCSIKNMCKELCPEMTYLLSLEESGRKEALFNIGVTDVVPYEEISRGKQRKFSVKSEDEASWREEAYQQGMTRRIKK